MRSNVEQCPYCGRYMAYECTAEYGENWRCSRQAEHIIADPEHWSVDTMKLGPDAVDVDGDPVYGHMGAHHLSEAQLRIILDLPVPVEEDNR